ncbi:MAG: hypothetical protein WDZ41_03735 [Candidatus Babeliales bacterium]
MKIKYFLLSITVLFLMQVQANDQEIFLQANHIYHENNFEEALKQYQAIEQKGPSVWYNMGNCNYYLKNVADSLICWRRSQLTGNSTIHRLAQQNIDDLHKELKHTMPSSYNFFDMLQAWSMSFPLFLWQCMFLLAWVFLFLMGSAYPRKGSRLLTFIFGISALALAVMLIVKYTATTKDIGIIIKETPLYISPSNRVNVQATMYEGQEVVITQKHNAWYKINHDIHIGWIPDDAVVRLKET